MIGYYDYTVLLTYLSAASGLVGIAVALTGQGRPFLGMFFLLFSGLCDAFDGKVARTKKDRTEQENRYGIQIDSLADLIAFGALPACLGVSMFRRYTEAAGENKAYAFLLYAIAILYVLAALIRLAFYNVTEEERQQTEKGVRKSYLGLPVTTSCLIFPLVMVLHYIVPFDITPIYLTVMLFTSFAFLARFSVTKPGWKGLLIMVGIGVIEAALLIVLYSIFPSRF